MALTQFGIVAAQPALLTSGIPSGSLPRTEPLDADFKVLIYPATDLPMIEPYGKSNRCPDGTVTYTGMPRMTIRFGALYARMPDNPTNPANTAQIIFEEIRTAQNECNSLCWLCVFDIDDLSWKKVRATVHLPEVAGKLTGNVLVNLELEIFNVGLDTVGTPYNGGEPNPPDPNAPGSSGSPFDGTLGWGGLGEGGLGQGGDLL